MRDFQSSLETKIILSFCGFEYFVKKSFRELSKLYLQDITHGALCDCAICCLTDVFPLFLLQKNLGYFIPYFCLDTLFLYLSIGTAVVGILIHHQATFRNSVVFAFKFYPSTCIYSLFKKLGGQPISISNYKSITHHITTTNSNPSIRLARSDNEFDESSRKSSSECMKPRVSFQTEHEASSFSEPNLSPQNVKHNETSILKPCFRKNLQLPVNNSYP